MSERSEGNQPERPAVDASLIEEMLRLSPIERLRQNDRAAALVLALQSGFSARGEPWPKPAR